MTAFLVSINGTGCLVEFNGKLHKQGFFTSRVVLADNREQAESKVLEDLHQLPELKEKVRNPKEDPMHLSVESIVEIGTPDPSRPVPSLDWYAEDETEQF